MQHTIEANQRLVSARYRSSGTEISTYDDGFGPLWISRNSIGINGIVRAQTWEDAYSICEDEFFAEAAETVDELRAEYGFRRESKKVIRTAELSAGDVRHPQLGAQEKFAELSDYTDNGKLPEGAFVRWETIETPDPDSWMDNELFCESYGLRNNGPNERDVVKHGIYAKDLNGDLLDRFSARDAEEIEILTEEWE